MGSEGSMGLGFRALWALWARWVQGLGFRAPLKGVGFRV